MGKLKKIVIGFGIIIGLFFALIIAVGISIEMEKANMTPEELQQWKDQREAEKLQKEIDEKKKLEDQKLWETQKALQAKQALEEYEARFIEEENLEIIKKQKEEAKLDTEEEVLEFIKNYKGKDNAGPTLSETFEKLLYISYPDENILTSPSTTVSMFAHKDFDKTDYNRYWKVELEIKTYRETAYYEWVIDNETNLVYPGNEDGKSFLNILDSFDK